MSYVAQEPWIFAGTIRENIIFGERYDELWYEKVLEACSLYEVMTDGIHVSIASNNFYFDHAYDLFIRIYRNFQWAILPWLVRGV